MFPKIIHQIWLQSTDKIPVKFHSHINKNINGNYEHILWDESKIIQLINANKIYFKTYQKSKIHKLKVRR